MNRREESGALILLDMDNFKYVNDILGHQEGDRLLKKMACVPRNSVRETDVVVRLGGDEFTIILPFTTQEQAQVFFRNNPFVDKGILPNLSFLHLSFQSVALRLMILAAVFLHIRT